MFTVVESCTTTSPGSGADQRRQTVADALGHVQPRRPRADQPGAPLPRHQLRQPLGRAPWWHPQRVAVEVHHLGIDDEELVAEAAQRIGGIERLGIDAAGHAGTVDDTVAGMDFSWTADQDALRDKARQVAADGVAAYGRFNDSWINGYSKEFSKVLAGHGWIGLTWPTEFGGGGRPPIERLIVGEEMIKAGAPIAASWFADRQMGPTLIAYGRPDQQAEFLPKILSGETTWCIGMSEPEAGSDLASLRTTADPPGRRVGDQRPEDLDELRGHGGLLLLHLPHVHRGPAARRHQRDHRADGHARASRSARSRT